MSSRSAPGREQNCKNNKVVICAHWQRLVWVVHQLLLLLLPTGKVQIQVQGFEVHLSSAQRQELLPCLGWEQSLVASQCHLLRHAWLLYIECAPWKFHVSQLNYRKGFWFLIIFFSVFRPAWSLFCVLEVLISSWCDQETFNASSH